MAQDGSEERFILYDVSWKTYQAILADHTDRRAPRFTFHDGALELVRPSAWHEIILDTLEQIVRAVTEAREQDCYSLGCVTHLRPDLRIGLEPDSCHFLTRIEEVKGRADFDLLAHPPPDLVIEVDISPPQLSKFPLYAAFGVPEIWHYHNDATAIMRLRKGVYENVPASHALPRLTPEIIASYLQASREQAHYRWLPELREWARETASS